MQKYFFSSLMFIVFSFHVKAQTSISGIINLYKKVDSFNVCLNTIYVEDNIGLNEGDRVLIIQMKGATINQTNSSAFGNLISYNDAGNYEFGTIKSIDGVAIQLENILLRTYDADAFVQLIQVPNYDVVSIDGILTAKSWDGQTGGVLVFDANEIMMNADIDVSGKGFRGGNAGNFTESCPTGLGTSLYYTDTLSGLGGEKGEGIALLSNLYLAARGKALNGGGGGNDHNGGAGGGSNAANGGKGGENDETLFSCPGDQGLGGVLVDQTIATDKIYLGGGGGAGHGNNNHGTDGGNGGGIVLINANEIIGNGFFIKANGISVEDLGYGDGSGGGGAGGSVCIQSDFVSDITIEADGGKGGDSGGNQCTGPGGGGSGGVLKHSGATLWPTVSTSFNGGIYGTNITTTSDCYGLNNGAASGGNGIVISDLIFSESTTFYNANFAAAGDDVFICPGDTIQFNASGGVEFLWSPPIYLDDPTIATPIVTATENTNYVVTVINENGCLDIDSLSLFIYPNPIANAGTDQSICYGDTATLSATGGLFYVWSPDIYLSDPTQAETNCFPSFDLNYTVTITDSNNCMASDSVFIEVNPSDFLILEDAVSVCLDGSVELIASGGFSYLWTPSLYLSDPTIANPICTPEENMMYHVSSTNADGCFDSDSISVEILPTEFAETTNEIFICAGSSVELNITGGDEYLWSPDLFLDNPFISHPVCTPEENITYFVSATSASGCIDIDTVSVFLFPEINALAGPDTSLCGGGQIYLFAEGGDTFSWTPSDGLFYDFYAEPLAIISSSIEYVVTVSNSITGCSATDTVTIVVLPEPILSVSEDTTICKGEAVELTANGAELYSWFPDSAIPCTIDCDTILVSPSETTLYVVTGTNADGCTATDSVLITVNICDEIENTFLNNLHIYPNPTNDFLYISSEKEISSIEIVDMQGKGISVIQKKINSNTFEIDLKNIPTQILFVKVISKNGMHVEKVLVE